MTHMFSFCSDLNESPLPLPATIDAERTALARIVAGLFALLGLGNGIAPQRIARAAHRAIAIMLRPAESAVRRLIYLVSLSITAKPAITKRPMPANLPRKGESEARPCFRLFDPRLRLLRKAKTTHAAPRITFFGDDVRTADLGRAPNTAQAADDITSAPILQRLEAIRRALDDLPRQARRLKRAMQRRSKVPRLKMQGVMRPGHPPGHRRKRLHEIDVILRRWHGLAREALPP